MNFLCRILIHAKNNWESVFGVKHTKKFFLLFFFSCLVSLTCPLCSKIIWILSILYLIFLSIFFFLPSQTVQSSYPESFPNSSNFSVWNPLPALYFIWYGSVSSDSTPLQDGSILITGRRLGLGRPLLTAILDAAELTWPLSPLPHH